METYKTFFISVLFIVIVNVYDEVLTNFLCNEQVI